MVTLGIETSCDETGLALYDDRHGLIGQVLASQVALHERYGGVVPELAARDHIRKLPLLLRTLLERSGMELGAVDGVAVTAGPGLVGALMVGIGTARSLAWALQVPAIGVHHMEAHLLAHRLAPGTPAPQLPFVALLVSGGHTMLVLVRRIGVYEVLGRTLDDAAGEAFDKTAQLLDLGYPGGPAIEAAAREGVPGRCRFTRPMMNRPGLDFSFSGLKTQVRDRIGAQSPSAQTRADVALAFQQTVAETLAGKCRRALEMTGVADLVVAGGVSANTSIRLSLDEMARGTGARVHYPPPEYCTDNGAMVALTGNLRLAQPSQHNTELLPRPRWPLDELMPLTPDEP